MRIAEFDVRGEYQGNAYPSQEDYRITLDEDAAGWLWMNVEDSGGAAVAKALEITPELADGIISMSQVDHGLGGYEDDWTLPVGMDRRIVWTLQTDMNHYVEIGWDVIDAIADAIKERSA